jgi:hypothetical protein
VWCLDSVTHGSTLFSGSVVDHEGDSYRLIKSSIVHLSLALPCYYRKHTMHVFSLVISPKLNNRRQSLLKLELEDLNSLLYTPILQPWLWSWVKLRLSYPHLCSFGFDIKTRLFSVKCYNSIISMCLRIVLCALINMATHWGTPAINQHGSGSTLFRRTWWKPLFPPK